MFTLYKRVKEIQKLKLNVDTIAKMLNEASGGLYPHEARIMDIEFNAGTRKVEFTIIQEYDELVDLDTPRLPTQKEEPTRAPSSMQVDPPSGSVDHITHLDIGID